MFSQHGQLLRLAPEAAEPLAWRVEGSRGGAEAGRAGRGAGAARSLAADAGKMKTQQGV
jgi:hypothetical protein